MANSRSEKQPEQWYVVQVHDAQTTGYLYFHPIVYLSKVILRRSYGVIKLNDSINREAIAAPWRKTWVQVARGCRIKLIDATRLSLVHIRHDQ